MKDTAFATQITTPLLGNDKAPRLSLEYDYATLEEIYMHTVHLPHYQHFHALWHRTLYQPLQRLVATLLDQDASQTTLHLCYVGAGPHLPLFQESELRDVLFSRLSKITLVDICSTALQSCQAQLRHLAPGLSLDTHCIDVTQGMGPAFLALLQDIFYASNSPEEIIARLDTAYHERPLKIACPQSAAVQCDAEVTYSEMMATSTGIAALLAFEIDVQHRFGANTHILAAARRLLQRYNAYAYAQQIEYLGYLTRPGGTIGIAADVEKIFQDPSMPSIPSFSDFPFPTIQQPTLQRMPCSFQEKIVWMDQPQKCALADLNLVSLQPHRHYIGIDVYQRGLSPLE